MAKSLKFISQLGLALALTLALGATSWAGQLNVTCPTIGCTIQSGVTLGGLVAGPVTTALQVDNDFSASVTSGAFGLSNGDYLYLYALTNNLTGINAAGSSFKSVPLSQATTATNFQDLFNVSVYGVLTTSGSSSGVTATVTEGPSSLIADFTGNTGGGLLGGDTIFFYAESTFAPSIGSFTTHDGGMPAFGPSVDPAPEPASMALLGTGLLGLGLLLRRRYAGAGESA